MDTSNLVATPVTHLTGAVTITSAAVSKTAELAASSSISPETVQTATKLIVTADTLAVASFIVMLLTFVWNIYLGFRKERREERQRQLDNEMRERELQLMEQSLNLGDGVRKKD